MGAPPCRMKQMNANESWREYPWVPPVPCARQQTASRLQWGSEQPMKMWCPPKRDVCWFITAIKPPWILQVQLIPYKYLITSYNPHDYYKHIYIRIYIYIIYIIYIYIRNRRVIGGQESSLAYPSEASDFQSSCWRFGMAFVVNYPGWWLTYPSETWWSS